MVSRGFAKFDLRGKTALITGAAGLLGVEHAAALLESGATAVPTDITDEGLAAAKASSSLQVDPARVLTQVMDVFQPHAIQAMAEELASNGLHGDILVNNAAIDPKVTADRGVIEISRLKAGLVGLTRYLATYWADRAVRANALSPGGIFNGQSEDFVRRLSSLIPLGRMAGRDEYRAAVQFLCSDASSYLNGQNIVMDGGRSVW